MAMSDTQSTGSPVAWIALVVAIVALVLGWMAFNRAGQDVVPTAVEQSEDAAEATRLAAARAEARTRLLAIQAQIAANEGYDEAVQETQEARAELQVAYANASAEARQEWQEIDAELEQLEQAARDESADAVGALERVLALLEGDLRTDEE